MSVYLYVGDVLREFWDDVARTYSAWDAAGVVVPGTPRPYTAEEDARAVEVAEAVLADSNRASIEDALAAALTDLQGIIDQTNADLRADPSQEIKTIARALRRTIRLLVRRFDGTS